MIEIIYCALILFGISTLSINPALGGGVLIGVALGELFETLGKQLIYIVLIVLLLTTYTTTPSPSYMGTIFALVFAL